MKDLAIIGRVEKVDLPKYNIIGIPAKVDTGADLSSIWISEISESKAGLKFKLFDEKSPFYTGEEISLVPGGYTITRISSSFGAKQIRYRVKLSVRLKGRLINGTFTLANRGDKLYPILIGRRLLKGKFLVDVSKGEPDLLQEKLRRQKMIEELNGIDKEL